MCHRAPGIQVADELRARNLLGPKAGEVWRMDLTIDQHEVPGVQLPGQKRERHFRCIGCTTEHGFTEEDFTDRHTVDPACQALIDSMGGSGKLYILASTAYVPSDTQRRDGCIEVVEANPDAPTPPMLDEIIFKFVPDLNSMVALVRTGDIDVAWEMFPDQVKELEKNPDSSSRTTRPTPRRMAWRMTTPQSSPEAL